MVRRSTYLLGAFLAFTSFESLLAIDYLAALVLGGSPLHADWNGNQGKTTGLQGLVLLLWQNSLVLASSCWIIFGATFFRGGISNKWRKLGFDKDVYDLMVKTRGHWSRLKLLNYLEAPRHRAELSQLSGLSWKEVDRELGLLGRYGLITLYAQSGSVRMYKLSEQGKMILKLVKELEPGLSHEILREPSGISN